MAAEATPAEEPQQPAPEPAYEPSKSEMNAHRRAAILHKYEQLKCPPASEWGKHGGTLRQIADFLEMRRHHFGPNMGIISTGPFNALPLVTLVPSRVSAAAHCQCTVVRVHVYTTEGF